MRVCLGGTFDPLHAGHRALLAAAASEATLLLVGITDGSLASRPDRDVAPWEVRAANVEAALRELGFEGALETHHLVHPLGPAATGDFDRIVVSQGTTDGAQAVNAARRAARLEPLEVQVVPFTLAQDLLPVSATRVHAGFIDTEGRRLQPVRVAVGSMNPVKVLAADAQVRDVLPCDVEVEGRDVASGVPEQPQGNEVLEGAKIRAAAALAAWPGADYGVGIEAGLQQDPDGGWFDVQCCVVVDALGGATRGWGPAFQYPEWVTRRALAGELVSDILGPLARDPRIGGTTGAIGYLSDGLLDRTGLTRPAVLMAFIPRIRSSLYVQEVRGPHGPRA